MAGVAKDIMAYLESDVGHVAALSDEAPVSWTPQEGGYSDREVHEEDDENAHIESPKQSMTDFSGESIHGGEGKIKNMDSVPSPEFPEIMRSAAVFPIDSNTGSKKEAFGSAIQDMLAGTPGGREFQQLDAKFEKDSSELLAWAKAQGKNLDVQKYQRLNHEINSKFERDTQAIIQKYQHRGSKKEAFGSAPQSAQPMKPMEPGQQPTIPGAMQIPQQQQIIMPTKEQLQQIAQFAGQLAAAAEGMKGVVPPNSAVAKMNQQGAIVVKIPLGTNPSLNLDLVKELGDDVNKGLYGSLKIWGLQAYSKVGQVQIQAGAAMKHPNLNKSHFVLAFSMQPGKAGPPQQAPDPTQPDPNAPI